jgi:hypothetical protein
MDGASGRRTKDSDVLDDGVEDVFLFDDSDEMGD